MTNRRTFLLIGGGVIAAGTVAWVGLGDQLVRRFTAATPCGLGAAMDHLIADTPGLRRLGAGIEQNNSALAAMDQDQIRAALKQRFGAALLINDSSALADEVSRMIAEDFSTNAEIDAVLRLDDWQLSRSEVLLALLAYRCLGDEALDASPDWSEQNFIGLQNWGPQSTEQGVSPNTQPDGHSGLWFRFDQPTQAWYAISIDGVRQPTFSNGDVLTTGLHGDLQKRILNNPGSYSIVLHDDMNRRYQPLGEFVVKASAGAEEFGAGISTDGFCEINRWGPKATRVGVAENTQPDGSMGIYVRIDCAPKDSRLYFNTTALETTVQDGLITARLPIDQLQTAGNFVLELRSASTKASKKVGDILVKP